MLFPAIGAGKHNHREQKARHKVRIISRKLPAKGLPAHFIADKYNQISNDFKIVEKDGKTEQYRDNENKTSDEEKNDKDTQ